MMILADTNVLLYARDRRDPLKQSRCADWLSRIASRGVLVISPQVASEHQSAAVQKLRESPADAAAATRALLEYCIRGTEPGDVARALDLVQKHQLSWWDALIYAWAMGAGCTHVLTEDKPSAPVLEGVRVINPFETAPDELLAARRA